MADLDLMDSTGKTIKVSPEKPKVPKLDTGSKALDELLTRPIEKSTPAPEPTPKKSPGISELTGKPITQPSQYGVTPRYFEDTTIGLPHPSVRMFGKGEAPKPEPGFEEKETFPQWLRRWGTQVMPEIQGPASLSAAAIIYLQELVRSPMRAIADHIDRIYGELKGDPTPDEVMLWAGLLPFGRVPGMRGKLPPILPAESEIVKKNISEAARPPAPGPGKPKFEVVQSKTKEPGESPSPGGQELRVAKGQLETSGPKKPPERTLAPMEAQPRPEGSAPETKEQAGSRTIADESFQLKNKHLARRVQIIQQLKSIPDIYKTPEWRIRLTRAATNPGTDKEAELVYNKYGRKWAVQTAILWNHIKGYGYDIDIDGFLHRVALGRGHPLDIEVHAREYPIPIFGRRGPAAAGLSKRAGGLEKASFYVMRRGEQRTLIQLDKDRKGFRVFREDGSSEHHRGTAGLSRQPFRFMGIERAKSVPDRYNPKLRFYDRDGIIDAEAGAPRTYHIERAKNEEIEALTEHRFNNDAFGVLAENYERLSRVWDNMQFIERLLGDPSLSTIITKDKEVADRMGWMRPDKSIPQFSHYYMPRRLAYAINDAFKQASEDNSLTQALDATRGFITRALFFTPIPHLANVFAHFIVARGFENFLPKGMATASKYGRKAIHDVLTLSPDYLAVLREGSGLWFAATETRNFNQLMLKSLGHEITRDMDRWGYTLKNWGFGIPEIYKASNRALWAGSDVMLLTRIYELQAKGLSLKAAIHEAERFIPNYRIPATVLGSRGFAQLLRSDFTLFGRYHYGLFRAFSEHFKDVIPKHSTGERATEALGHIFTLMVGTFATYPLADLIIQNMTNSREAGFLRSGPYGLIENTANMLTGQKMWAAFLGGIFTAGPAIDMIEEARYNKYLYSGKPIVYPGSSAGMKGLEAGTYLLSKLSPLAYIQQGLSGKQDIGELLLRQALIDTKKYKNKMFITRRDLRGKARDEATIWKELRLDWIDRQIKDMITPKSSPPGEGRKAGPVAFRGKQSEEAKAKYPKEGQYSPYPLVPGTRDQNIIRPSRREDDIPNFNNRLGAFTPREDKEKKEVYELLKGIGTEI